MVWQNHSPLLIVNSTIDVFLVGVFMFMIDLMLIGLSVLQILISRNVYSNFKSAFTVNQHHEFNLCQIRQTQTKALISLVVTLMWCHLSCQRFKHSIHTHPNQVDTSLYVKIRFFFSYNRCNVGASTFFFLEFQIFQKKSTFFV